MASPLKHYIAASRLIRGYKPRDKSGLVRVEKSITGKDGKVHTQAFWVKEAKHG